MSACRLSTRRVIKLFSFCQRTEIKKAVRQVHISSQFNCDPISRSPHSTVIIRHFHVSLSKNTHDQKSLETHDKLTIRSTDIFNELTKKRAADKVTFQKAIKIYISKESVYRRGHVEFIYASLSRMKEFGCHRDLEMYKKILEVFPEKKMIPKSAWQVEMMHYPRQQQCAIDVMEQMENNGHYF